MGPPFLEELALLYQRKGRSEIAVRVVLNFLITRQFVPGYSLQVGVLCVAE